MSEFSSYESIPANSKNKVITANGETFIEGKGTVFLKHEVERNGRVIEQRTTRLSPVYYIPWIIFSIDVHGRIFTLRLEFRGDPPNLLS